MRPTNRSKQSNREPDTRPDWVAKSPRGEGRRGEGRRQKLERVGAGWSRDSDNGICIRLYGTQIISDDIYLYPIEEKDENGTAE